MLPLGVCGLPLLDPRLVADGGEAGVVAPAWFHCDQKPTGGGASLDELGRVGLKGEAQAVVFIRVYPSPLAASSSSMVSMASRSTSVLSLYGSLPRPSSSMIFLMSASKPSTKGGRLRRSTPSSRHQVSTQPP